MKKWAVESNTTTLVKFDEDLLDSQLKPMVYTLAQTPMGQYYLSHIKDRFDIDTLYGTLKARVNKILHTYKQRTNSTGVLLTGDKGSGKTLLSKVVANSMIDAGKPVILINQAFRGDGFNSFMDDIGDCCVLFDEFAKVYSSGSDNHDDFQESLLTFFDGTMSTKRLCIVTENNAFRINDFMKDRPGRMFYHFKYDKLDEQTITEVCDKQLKSNKIPQIINLSRKLTTFSFDILTAIIEESNRFPDESILTIAEDLNIPSINAYKYTYTVLKITDLSDNPYELSGVLTSTSLDRAYSYKEDENNEDVRRVGMYEGNIVYEEKDKIILENHGVRIYIRVTETPLIEYSTKLV